MFQRLQRLNLFHKYVTFLIGISVVPLLILGASSYQVSRQILEQEAERYTRVLIQSQRAYLELQLRQVEELAFNLSGVQPILDALDLPSDQVNPYTDLSTRAQVGYILDNYTSVQGLVSIDLFSVSGAHYHVGDTLDTSSIRSEVQQRLFTAAQSSPGRTLWLGMEENVNVNSAYTQVVTAVRMLTRTDRSNLNLRPVGLLVINLTPELYKTYFDAIKPTEGSTFLLLDAYGRVIYHPNQALVGTKLQTQFLQKLSAPYGNFVDEIDRQSVLVSYERSQPTGWVLVSLIPTRILYQPTNIIGQYTLIVFLGLMGVMAAFSWLVLNWLVLPLRQLSSRIEQIQTDPNAAVEPLPVKSKDEIGEVVSLFNDFQNELVEKRAAEQSLRLSEERFRTIFQTAMVSIWEVDFSQVSQAIEQLRADGVEDFRTYFRANPDVVREIARKIRAVDVNEWSLQMYEADSKGELLANLETVLALDSVDVLTDELAAVAEGRPKFEYEAVNQTLKGKTIQIWFSMRLDPSNAYRSVLVTVMDITEQKHSAEALQQSEERLRNLLDNTVDWVWQVDKDFYFSYVSPRVQELLGITPEELIGGRLDKVITEDEWQRILPEMTEITTHFGRINGMVMRLHKPSGETVVCEVNATPLFDARGEFCGYGGITRDITEREAAAQRLKESEERYALAVRGATDGIWDWDLIRHEVYYSPRWKAILGYGEAEITQSISEWMGRVHPDDLPRVKLELDAYLKGQKPYFESEHRLFHRNGRYFWALMRGVAEKNEQGEPCRMAGSLTDVSVRKMTEDRLRHDAMHDTLTGLHNRAYFMDQLVRSIERFKRHPDFMAAVLLLDLDRFRLINDSLGHSRGDQLLIAVSHRLKTCLRLGDTIARLGGDEFILLVEDIRSLHEAKLVAGRIQNELNQPFDLNGQEVFVSASMGIAFVSGNYDSGDDLVRDADTAMNQVKSSGRGRFQVFESEMHQRSLIHLQLEGELRRALERNEFDVYYQPVVNLGSGRITRLEALIRWQHPTRGLIMPSDFISLAEDTGLIIPVGAWVLRTACQQLREWKQMGQNDLQVSVNISAYQLQDSDFLDLVKAALAENELEPTCLNLEITESAAMQDLESTLRLLHELEQLGVEISIDDFGISYSSLGQLQRFPVNSIKIDQLFIRRTLDNQDDAAITTAIIAMGHILKLKVIAEGVEDQRQLDFLIAEQCDEVQGFLVCYPRRADEITALLREKRSMLPVSS